jgi:hypothetical protein
LAVNLDYDSGVGTSIFLQLLEWNLFYRNHVLMYTPVRVFNGQHRAYSHEYEWSMQLHYSLLKSSVPRYVSACIAPQFADYNDAMPTRTHKEGKMGLAGQRTRCGAPRKKAPEDRYHHMQPSRHELQRHHLHDDNHHACSSFNCSDVDCCTITSDAAPVVG